MTSKHLARFFCLILSISFACDDASEDNNPAQEGYYVFGRQNASAVYWKDGRILGVDGNTAYFTGAAVSGSDVYAIGYVNDEKTYRGAAYWKNGKMVRLSNVSSNQVPTAIAFSGSDMYIAGFEDIADKSFTIYWKNGEVHALSDKEGFARPTAIAVSGSGVHIVGWGLNRIFDADTILLMYWKNGERIKVNPTASHEMIEDIAVSGNDVYFSGYTFDDVYHPRAKVWKNGAATELTDGSVVSFASKVEVHENDVYVAGKNGTRAVYWKNASMIPLETGAVAGSDVSGLAVVRDELIISGKNYGDGFTYQGSFIWKAGGLQAPFTGTSVNFIIDCIAPVQ